MELVTNILVVEDEPEWRGVYERAAAAQVAKLTVRAATDLASAERLIVETKFAVAFIDVGLDVDDDRNTDGLLVMRQIRAIGDETSIVVVTGRSGRDVLGVTRDAIKMHHAFDVVGKGDVTPFGLRKLIETGIAEYRRVLPPPRAVVREALRGPGGNPVVWDDQMMRAVRFQAGASSFYDYLAAIFGGCLPLVGRHDGSHGALRIASSLVHGSYWSRSMTCAVGLCFGTAEVYQEAAGTPYLAAELFGVTETGQPVRELTRHGVRGGVFRLEPLRRDDFAVSCTPSSLVR